MQYNKIKLTVGLFVLGMFIFIGMFLYILLDEKGAFDKRYNYHFNAQSADSFNIGMPLKFSGFNIGVIDDIALKDDGSVDMTFSVNEENKKWISTDTVLIVKKPLIGSPHIQVLSAIGKKPLKAGSTLTILMSDDINDMISKLEPAVNSLINIINSVELITSYIASDDSTLIKSLYNLEKLTAKLANGDSLLTKITGNKESTKSLIDSLNTIAQITKEIHIISKDISNITKSLDKDIVSPSASAMKKLDSIMKDIKQKLELMDGTVKAVGSYDKDLVELKEQILLGLKKSNQIMDKIDSLMSDEKKDEVKLP